MKNYVLLSALFLILAVPSAFSQKSLPAGMHPYPENLPVSLIKLLHRAGFDQPAMANASPVAPGVSLRNALQLDSTKTFYGYDQNGGPDSLPLSRTIYHYPAPNLGIETTYQYENDGWQPLDRLSRTSDDQQRLLEVYAELFDPATQAFQPDSRLEIFPHGDSPVLIDSFFTYLWDADLSDWHLILAVHNSFDAQDRQLESVTSFEYFDDPLIFQEFYAYDANGDNHLIEEFAVIGADVFPSSRTEMSYVGHRLIEGTIAISDGIGFVPHSRTNYAYTTFGALRKHLTFQWTEQGNWYLNEIIDYAYDDAQRLAGRETALLPLNGPEERERVSYAYVEGENLYLERVSRWDDDLFDWVLDSKKYYYYEGLTSAAPAPVAVNTLTPWPNPANQVLQLNLRGDAQVQVFDLSGQAVLACRMQLGQALDLQGLPAGVYVVTARQGGDFYSSRVVKQ